jgi:hypothetical protein
VIAAYPEDEVSDIVCADGMDLGLGGNHARVPPLRGPTRKDRATENRAVPVGMTEKKVHRLKLGLVGRIRSGPPQKAGTTGIEWRGGAGTGDEW